MKLAYKKSDVFGIS